MWCCVQSTFIVPNHISFIQRKVYTFCRATTLFCLAKFCTYVYIIKLNVMSDWMEHDLPNTSPTEGWNTMTPHEHTQVIMMFIFLLVSFLLRNTPLGFMWRWVKIFMFVLVATLLADHIKKSLKEWWNK